MAYSSPREGVLCQNNSVLYCHERRSWTPMDSPGILSVQLPDISVTTCISGHECDNEGSLASYTRESNELFNSTEQFKNRTSLANLSSFFSTVCCSQNSDDVDDMYSLRNSNWIQLPYRQEWRYSDSLCNCVYS